MPTRSKRPTTGVSTNRRSATQQPTGTGGAGATPRPASLADDVLRLIWTEQAISRAEIARRTGLSRSTVSDIVTTLMATKLVAETGVGASRGGRRPVVLTFQDQARVILGVDVGASHVRVVLTDLRGQVLTEEYREHPVRTDPAGTTTLVTRLCQACLKTWGGKKAALAGIGVALPSPIDPRHPDRVSQLAMPAWQGRHGFEALGAQLGAPVVLIDNDANLGAVAEQWWGAGRGVQDFTYIKLATGIGAGHMIGGRLYRGSSGVAGEIGHLAIDPKGAPCVCGNRGCLTTYVGAQALEERARALLRTYPKSVLATGTLTIDAIEDAALAHDPLALQVVGEAASQLGIAISGLLNIVNPAVVILGGGLARLGGLLLEPLRETVHRRTFVSSVVASEIRHSELGPRAIAIGAATLVLDAALNGPDHLLLDGAR